MNIKWKIFLIFQRWNKFDNFFQKEIADISVKNFLSLESLRWYAVIKIYLEEGAAEDTWSQKETKKASFSFLLIAWALAWINRVWH